MAQGLADIYEQARARSTDPATSRAAAASVDLRNIHMRWIVRAYREFGPMHDEQLCRVLKKHYEFSTPSGTRSRRRWLVVHGIVEDSGRRAVSASGRDTIIWRLCSRDTGDTT